MARTIVSLAIAFKPNYIVSAVMHFDTVFHFRFIF